MDIVYCFAVLVLGCIFMMLGSVIFVFSLNYPTRYREGLEAFAKNALSVSIAGLGMAIILGSLGCMSALIACILGGRL